MTKRLAGYFRCGSRDVPIYDGGDTIAPFAPYRAPSELRPLPADVLRMAQDDYLRAEQRARREHGSAYCTPSRYDSMMRHNMRGEDDYEELVYDPLAQPHRRIVPAPAVAPQLKPVVQPEPALPVAVPDWPMRPAVVETEPVPVVVNRTAARFGALELRKEDDTWK